MTAIQQRLWKVDEYHRMIDIGILTSDDRVELLDGIIFQMSPQRPPHAATTQRASDYLKALLSGKAHVRMQLPITLPTSEPEPDIAVVRIDPGSYADHHPSPSEILLLIEVAYSSFDTDCKEKALIYAKANIADYWVLDVSDARALIYRNPTLLGYQSEIILDEDAVLASLAFPDIEIPFRELFLP